MDVRMPDGRIIKNVPEGTTRAQIMAKLGGVKQQPREEPPGLFQRAVTGVVDMLNPEGYKEDIPELPYWYQGDPQHALDTYRQYDDPTARMDQDITGNTVFEGEKGRFYPDQPGFTFNDVPQFQTDAMKFANKAAPMIAGGVATAPAKFIPAVGSMLGIGAASGGATEGAESLLEGRKFDPSVPINEALITGGGEVGARALFFLLKPLAARVWGPKAADVPMVKQSGELTDDGIKLLERAKTLPEAPEILDKELAKLTRQGALTTEEAQRANLFIKRGLQPTKAQVTRTADDFTAQQEALKRSGPVRSAIENQDVAIQRQFQDLAPKAPGRAPEAFDSITSRVGQADEAIDAAYKAVRESLPDEKLIKLPELTETVRQSHGEDALSGGVYSAVKGQLRNMGLIDEQWRPTGRMSPRQAEELRIYMNKIGRANPDAQHLLSQYKQALDKDVEQFAGQDFFREARGQKATLEQSLNRTRAGRRDQRKASGLVRDIVENRIGREQLLPKINSAATRAEDLADLKQFLLDAGDDASWQAIRRDVLENITERAFKGAEGEQGVANITKTKLESALKPYSDDKLAVLFDAKERAFLKDMQELMRYREPVTGRQQGRGPSAMAIGRVESLVRRLPYMGNIGADILKHVVQIAGDSAAARKALESGIGPTGKALTNAQAAAVRKVFLDALGPKVTPVGGVVSGSIVAEQ